MAIASFGTSTPFAYWGFATLCKIVGALTGDVIRIHGTTLGELREGWGARDGRSVVFTTDLPEKSLCDFFLGNRVRTIVFLDDPRDAVMWAIASRALTVEQALRFSTRAFSAISEPSADDASLIVPRWADTDIRDLIRDISVHLGGDGGDEEVDLILRAGLDGYVADTPSKVEDCLARCGIRGAIQNQEPPEIGASAKALVDRVVGGYRPLFHGSDLSNILWPNDLFFGADGKPAFAPIDIVGGARTLVWGPYMFLPRGRWKATVVFEVVDNFGNDPVIVDVRSDTVLVEKVIRMPKFGIFSYTMEFEVEDPNKPIEVRLVMTKGAIEGVFLLKGVAVTPAAATTSEALAAPVSATPGMLGRARDRNAKSTLPGPIKGI